MSRARAQRRGARVRRIVVAVLAIMGTLAILGAFQRPVAARPRAPGPTLGTPLWSVRRIPQPIVDAVGAQQLRGELLTATAGNRACFVVHDPNGIVTESDADTPLTPASTIKLLTAIAALDRLGPEFRFRTRAQSAAAPRAGTVDRLYLVGGGDPLLATPERIARDNADPKTTGLATTALLTLAERITAAGITAIPGGIIGIDDRYDAVRYLPDWSAAARAAIGPIGGLTVNDGFTGAAGTGGVVTDPALNAATELTRLLQGRGVTVGPPGRGGPPSASPIEIAAIESAPLPAILTEMLSASDNLTAEILVRELGAGPGADNATPDNATPATSAGGTDAARAAITALGVPMAGVTMVDGSGLGRANAVPCRTLQAVLDLTSATKFAPIRDGLAIAGQRGTLADRLSGTPLVGNLRAKTGTLNGVSGLAGFVTGDRPLTFSLLLNGDFGETQAFALREAMATTIARFPQAAGGAELVPAPNAPIPPRACLRTESPC